MKRILCATLGAAVGAIGIAACDVGPKRDAAVSRPVARPAETEASAAGEAIAAAVRDEDAFARARKLGTLLPSLGPEAVPAVKEVLKDQTLDLGAAEFELLLRFWATHEPAEASRWAVEVAPAGYQVSAILSTLTVWAEADPQAAWSAGKRWMEERQKVRDAVRIATVRGWYAANPSELAAQIKRIDRGLLRQRALLTYIRALIRDRGPEAAMRWAESISDDDATYKLNVFRQLAGQLPLFDVEAAFRFCDAHCDGPYGSDLRAMIARRWVRKDGPAALAWLSQAPEGYERNIAVRATFSLWGEVDRDAALAWMTDQTASGEPDPWLHPLYPVYARLLARDSPTEAVRWLERIENEKDREWELIRFARAWRQVDEAAAEAWLRESPLSEEAREKARAPAGPLERFGFPG